LDARNDRNGEYGIEGWDPGLYQRMSIGVSLRLSFDEASLLIVT